MFTKQHYEFIAAVLRDTQPGGDNDETNKPLRRWQRIVSVFVARFRADNENFDQERFLKACKARGAIQ